MPKFVVYEIWTRHRIVKAKTATEALRNHMPVPVKGLHLSNWHAVEVPVKKPEYRTRHPFCGEE